MMDVITKICKQCGEEKPLSEMEKCKKSKDGTRKTCMVCKRKRYFKSRSNNVERQKQNQRKSHLMNRYKITLEEYDAMVIKQDNKCGICGREGNSHSNTRHLDVDHCHNTGLIRGLLCNRCNQSMGKVKDNPELLMLMYKWLTQGGYGGLEIH